MFKVHFIYATMDSGKTTKLLQNQFSYQQADIPTYLLTPKIDTRNGVDIVKARIGLQATADVVVNDNPSDKMLKDVINKAYHTNGVIMVDEAQFIKPSVVYSIVDQCRNLDFSNNAKKDYFTLYAYGLLTDFRGRLFEGTKAWIELADSIRKEDTKCAYCNRKATYNLLTKHTTDSNIQIGDSEYKPVCSYHYWYYNHINKLREGK